MPPSYHHRRADCCDVCSSGTCGLRCGLCGSILLIIAGVGLTIAGISVLGYVNPREELTASYNRAGDAYTATDFAPFGTMNFQVVPTAAFAASVPSTSFTQAASPVPIVGSIEKVSVFYSRIFHAHSVPRSALSSLTIKPTNAASGFSAQLLTSPPTRSVSQRMLCTAADCDGRDNCECTVSQMRDKCELSVNGTYSPSRGDCDRGEYCGTCRYTAYLTSVCIPVTFNPTTLTAVPSSRYTACNYPLTNTPGEYGSAQPASTVAIQLMADTDPYIEAQRLTKGSMDFGWSTKDQTSVGVGLLIPGLAAIAFAIGTIVWIQKAHATDLAAEEARIAAEEGNDNVEMQQHAPAMQGGVVLVGEPMNNNQQIVAYPGYAQYPAQQQQYPAQQQQQAHPQGYYSTPSTPAQGQQPMPAYPAAGSVAPGYYYGAPPQPQPVASVGPPPTKTL